MFLVLYKLDQYNLSSGGVKLLDKEEIITNTRNCTNVLIIITLLNLQYILRANPSTDATFKIATFL